MRRAESPRHRDGRPRRRPTGRRAAGAACLVIGVLTLPTCGPPADRDATATVRDSLGVEIVENAAPPGALRTWTLSAEPEAVIGALGDIEPSHQFTEVRGAVRLSDGRIVVGDWGSREARYFDAAGRHLLTVGGEGEGPGEVRFLFNVDRVRGDTLVVGGWPIGSRYWYDERGGFIRNQALGPWFPGRLGRTLPDGSLILDTFEFGSYGNTLETWAANGPDDDLRPEGVVELVTREGERVDTLAPLLGEWHHKTGQIRLNFASHALPFTPDGLVAWSADRVFVGHSERPEVRVYDLDGALVRIIRWAGQRLPVTGADRTRFAEEVIQGLRRPDQAPNYRRWLSEISYPDEKPYFQALIADESGYLWVRPHAPAAAAEVPWTVYGPDGRAAATVTVPAEYRLLDVDATHLLATWKDDLDVDLVSAHRVERR